MPVKRPAGGDSPQSIPKISKTDPQTESDGQPMQTNQITSDCKFTDLGHDLWGMILSPSHRKTCRAFKEAIDQNCTLIIEQIKSVGTPSLKNRLDQVSENCDNSYIRLKKLWQSMFFALPIYRPKNWTSEQIPLAQDFLEHPYIKQSNCTVFNDIITHNYNKKWERAPESGPYLTKRSQTKRISAISGKVQILSLQLFEDMNNALQKYEIFSYASSFQMLSILYLPPVNKACVPHQDQEMLEYKWYLKLLTKEFTTLIVGILNLHSDYKKDESLSEDWITQTKIWQEDASLSLNQSELSEYRTLNLTKGIIDNDSLPLNRELLIQFKNITTLTIINATIPRIPEWINQFEKLTDLKLIGISLFELPDHLLYNTTIRRLDLRCNPLEDISPLAAHLPQLQYLRLEDTPAYERGDLGLKKAVDDYQAQASSTILSSRGGYQGGVCYNWDKFEEIGKIQAEKKEAYRLEKIAASTSTNAQNKMPANGKKEQIDQLHQTLQQVDEAFSKVEMSPELANLLSLVIKSVNQLANLNQ